MAVMFLHYLFVETETFCGRSGSRCTQFLSSSLTRVDADSLMLTPSTRFFFIRALRNRHVPACRSIRLEPPFTTNQVGCVRLGVLHMSRNLP